MLSIFGLRTASAFGHSITSNEVQIILLVGPVIVRLSPTPLAIYSATSPESPNPTTLATSLSAFLCAFLPPAPTVSLRETL